MQFQASYGFAPAAVYGGNLSNSGETVALRDAAGTTIDTVSYGEADPWPVSADGTGPSLELIDATLGNDDPLNWASATNAAGRTPGAANSVRRSGLGPRVTGLTATPANPTAGESVTVTATITDQTSAVLRYRTDFAAEQSVAMTDSGGDTWSATIPGAAAGHLIRYRVEATNTVATTRSPRIDDTVTYRGVVVASGITSPVPQWEWFIAPADYTLMVNNPTQEIVRYGAIAYDGRVYDNIEMEIKGHASQNDPKVSWKFKTPPGYDFDMPGLLVEPVDELDMQADWSDRSHGRAILSWDAYERAGFEDHTMFTVRTQRNAAFQGIYNLQETYDGTWREREGYDDNQFFEAETSAFSTRPISVQFSKKEPADTDFSSIAAFVNGVRLTGTARRNYLLANADIPQMINYAAVTAIVEHHDSSSKNFYLALEPADQPVAPAAVGPRPHARQRLLQRQQHLRDPGGAGRQHQCPDARDPRRARVARHVLPSPPHPGQRPPGSRSHGGAVRRPPRSGRAGGHPRLLGVALPGQPGQLLDVPQAALRRPDGAAHGVRHRRPGPRQPAGLPGHPDRRDPALPHRRRHGRVRRALQPRHAGHRPLRMDHRRRRRTDGPARDRDPAALGPHPGRQRPGDSAPRTAPPSSSATASPVPSPPPAPSP